MIQDTASFQAALEVGQLDQAITWFEKVKDDPKYDARWRDHRSRELIEALCSAARFDDAAKYVPYARTKKAIEGRRDKISWSKIRHDPGDPFKGLNGD